MSIKLDTSNETPQGLLDGGQSLVACYRDIVDTMALKAFREKYGERPKAESKNRRLSRISTIAC